VTVTTAPAGPTIDAQNPWPGLREFDEAAERFFNGRAEESAALRRLVMQAPLTVLFGASGLGKTSLLQAGLFPLLRQDHFLPIYLRLDLHDRPAPLIDQVKQALQTQLRSQHVDAPEWPEGESLWEYLHRANLELWGQHNHLLTPVIVLDQFEEVFTLGSNLAAAVSRLKIDLADLIENRMPEALAALAEEDETAAAALALNRQRYKVILSFREDFLPVVEGLKRTIPSIMRNRLRLLPMSGDQAFDAVHKTAPHLADAAMARRIVAFVAGRDEATATQPGSADAADDLAVEPALLSLVCAGLNEKRELQHKATFDPALLEGTGQAIVEDFYLSKMSDMPAAVHRFIERELITLRGFRKPCDLDDARRVHGVDDSHLQRLVDRRLLRIEVVRGTPRVELTHDLLTPIVRKYRDRQLERERLAKERHERRRLTAIGVALGVIALISVGAAFYAQALRRNADSAAKKADEARVTAEDIAGKLQMALATVTDEKRKAESEKLRAEQALDQAAKSAAAEKAATATAEKLAKSEGAARAEADKEAKRATTEQQDAQRARDESRKSEAAAIADRTRAINALRTAEDATTAATNNATAALLARGEADRLRNLSVAQSLASRARVLQREADLPLAAQMVAHAYLLHAANCRTTADATTPCPPELIDPNLLSALQTTLNRLTRATRTNSYAAGGIVSGSGGGAVLRIGGTRGLLSARPGAGVARIDLPTSWRQLAERAPVIPVPVFAPADRRVTAIALAPLGLLMAQGRLDDGAIEVWNGSGRLYQGGEILADRTASKHSQSIVALAFSPDSVRVVSATADGVLRVWYDDQPLTKAFLRPPRSVRALLFVPDGNAVLAATNRGIVLWRLAGAPLVFSGTENENVRSMAFSSDGLRFAFGNRTGEVRIANWIAATSSFSPALPFDDKHLSSVDALAFSPSGRLLASAGADGTIRLFQVGPRAGGLPAVLEGHSGAADSVVFSDDTLLYSGGADGTLRVWLTRMDVLAALICRETERDTKYSLRPFDQTTLQSLLPQDNGGRGGTTVPNACMRIDRNPGSSPTPRTQ
jgi:hypothetical protein